MIKAQGLDLTVTATTDRRAGLRDVDAVLSSFRPGGFDGPGPGRADPDQARRDRPGDAGPGRVVHVAALDPGAQGGSSTTWPRSRRTRRSSTTPTRSTSSPRRSPSISDATLVSMCEGPITSPRRSFSGPRARSEPRAQVTMAGVNHNCWSTEHTYDGEDLHAAARAGVGRSARTTRRLPERPEAGAAHSR